MFLDLLSHLLIKAFENYDMENMITAFLIARQAALEGPAVFMPYSEWFKVRLNEAWLVIFVLTVCEKPVCKECCAAQQKPGFRQDSQELERGGKKEKSNK